MRSKIIWKFLGAFIFLTLIAVFVLNFFVSLKLRDHFEQKITEKLQSNALLVGNILKDDLRQSRHEDIQKRMRTLAEELDLRITVIDEHGRVLGKWRTIVTGLKSLRQWMTLSAKARAPVTP